MQPKSIAEHLEPHTRAFYEHTLTILRDAQIPFIVGGAYAFERYTGIARHTKDLDLFVREVDCERVLDVLAKAGYQSEMTFPHWLAKAYSGDDFVDVIFSSGNGLAPVSDDWFEYANDDEVLGIPIKLCPPEEMLWSKMFIMERERYDGADVAHLLHAVGERLDWSRLMQRIGKHWHVLLSHLILFRFIYPSKRDLIPNDVLQTLLRRLETEMQSAPPKGKLCRGPLLSRAQYLTDVEQWGYHDARITPLGNMTPEETEQWTAAIDEEE